MTQRGSGACLSGFFAASAAFKRACACLRARNVVCFTGNVENIYARRPPLDLVHPPFTLPPLHPERPGFDAVNFWYIFWLPGAGSAGTIKVEVLSIQNIDFAKPRPLHSPWSISPLRVRINARLVDSYRFRRLRADLDCRTLKVEVLIFQDIDFSG